MKAQAYVLVSVSVGYARKVYQGLQDISEIAHVDAVTGPYDMIAKIDTFDYSTIGQLIFDKIWAIEGVADTITCHVISMEN